MNFVRKRISRWYKSFRWTLWWYCCKFAIRFPRFAAVYYFFDDSFSREHRAVLVGKLEQFCRGSNPQGDAAKATLRRCIHRLEKGLIMRPLRSTFAVDYIDEAVGLYKRLAAATPVEYGQAPTGESDPLLGWSHDVLHEFFTVAHGHPTIERARARFEAVNGNPEPGSQSPFYRDVSPLRISIDDMITLAVRRRSVRCYQQRAVPREMIDKAIDVARMSPSACNRQPFQFRIFDDPVLIRRIGSIPMGVKGFFENFTCLAVLVGQLRCFQEERDRHVIYIDASLAAMAFQFALEVQGIGSCCINWADVSSQEREMAHVMNLAPDERVIMCISLGFPDPNARVPFSQKKSIEEIRYYNLVGED